MLAHLIMRFVLLLFVLLMAPIHPAIGVDYPIDLNLDGSQLRIHHPVVDSWEDFRVVEGWIPVEIRLAGGDRLWVGSVRARANTLVDREAGLVRLSGQQVLSMNFTGESPPEAVQAIARRAVRSSEQTLALDVLLAELADDFRVPAQGRHAAELAFTPPRIVVTDRPMQLLLIDKEPVRAPVSGTGLEFVVNSDWRLFYHPEGRDWYVINQGAWQRNSFLASGGWTTTDEIPDDFRTLAIGDRWPQVAAAFPAAMPVNEPQPFMVALEPTELIAIDGEPRLAAVGSDGLQAVSNTAATLFQADGRWFYLAAGRWFSAPELDGRWQPVNELPGVFASIPADHALAGVRASVPGTMESVMALLEASLPHERRVPADAGASLSVGYVGQPQFVPIAQTSLARAVNSPFTIIRHNNFYYLCHDAAWYFARNPTGPWEVARSIPDEIYRIPASDPAHFVTYVFPPSGEAESARQDEVVFQYNNGYLGDYSTGVTVVQGTGWYYDPWLWNSPAGYPVYWGHPWTYGWRHPWGGRWGYPNHYYGGYWSSQQISFQGEYYGINGEADPAFQDPRVARRGHSYTTLADQRAMDGLREFTASDDLYADRQGNVYRRSDEGWSQHTESGWSTMAELERHYGAANRRAVGDVEMMTRQRQAYQQNPDDIARMERYYRNRQRAYNMHSSIYVGR